MMKKNELYFKDSEFIKSNRKDHDIKIKYDKKNQALKLVVPYGELKEENLTLSEDKKYYLLYIKPSVILPDRPGLSYEIELKLAISRNLIDGKNVKLNEIVNRAFIEGDMFRSYYNQNYDGRFRGVYYGGSFS